MINQKLKDYNIILASASPRRQLFLNSLDIDFKIELKPIEERYPDTLIKEEISDYLSQLKAKPFINNINENDILITSDTIVWHNNKALGKPKDNKDAFDILMSLSGKTHEVITSVSLTSSTKQIVFNDITKVSFKTLSEEEIRYYINTYKPFDKAGAYGIQEWIGQIGVTKIEGSYFNVMGFPIHLVYSKLLDFIK